MSDVLVIGLYDHQNKNIPEYSLTASLYHNGSFPVDVTIRRGDVTLDRVFSPRVFSEIVAEYVTDRVGLRQWVDDQLLEAGLIIYDHESDDYITPQERAERIKQCAEEGEHVRQESATTNFI